MYILIQIEFKKLLIRAMQWPNKIFSVSLKSTNEGL